MKPILAITDYNILRELVNYSSPAQNGKEAALLRIELNKATVLNDNKLSDEIVRLNSQVEIQELNSGKISTFKIVLPSQANLKENKVSVLAPMSIALLGFKKGYTFDWQMPGGLKRIRIVNVQYSELDIAA